MSTAIVERQVLCLDTAEDAALFDITRAITKKSYDKFMDQYSRLEIDEDFTLVVNSTGGFALYTMLLANVLALHEGRITAQVPRYAMSGATILALICDTIEMSPSACLGKIDPQLVFPLKTLVPALHAHKEQSILCSIAHDVLCGYMPDHIVQIREVLLLKYKSEEVDQLIAFFNDGTSGHDTPIYARHLVELPFLRVKIVKGLKLPVKTKPCVSSKELMRSVLGQF
jgi:Serine dehydrogenase proteinase